MYVSLGGIDQWINIHQNPVLLFVTAVQATPQKSMVIPLFRSVAKALHRGAMGPTRRG
jgi:hypothetical protein